MSLRDRFGSLPSCSKEAKRAPVHSDLFAHTTIEPGIHKLAQRNGSVGESTAPSFCISHRCRFIRRREPWTNEKHVQVRLSNSFGRTSLFCSCRFTVSSGFMLNGRVARLNDDREQMLIEKKRTRCSAEENEKRGKIHRTLGTIERRGAPVARSSRSPVRTRGTRGTVRV